MNRIIAWLLRKPRNCKKAKILRDVRKILSQLEHLKRDNPHEKKRIGDVKSKLKNAYHIIERLERSKVKKR